MEDIIFSLNLSITFAGLLELFAVGLVVLAMFSAIWATISILIIMFNND